jgi:aryl-alcohol dehydrogenase-like predicted oxidoreductase
MNYRKLGRLGLRVSPLCLGTMNFGWEGSGSDEQESHAIMDRALELGINFFDTANVYGWSGDGRTGRGTGITEQIIGRWFAQDSERREKIVLATKVFGSVGSWPNDGRLSARHIRAACERSLRNLQTDYIDLYQMHHVDRDTPWEEIWQAMEQLVREGKVLYIGSSNFAGWHIAQANESARARNFLGLVSEQSLYNLDARMIELEVVPACESYGLGLLPWSPLGGGLLGGALGTISEGRRASAGLHERVERDRPRLERYESFCRELGEEPADVALAWLLANPVVTAPIIGPRTVEQLDSGVRALDVHLDESALNTLDEIFPGPGGPAPEAYAW